MMKQTQWRYNQDIGIKEIYDYYCHMYFKEKFIKKDGTISKKSTVHKNSKYNISIKLYNDIIKDFHDIISEEILKGIDFNIPERLGVIGIRKNKTKIKIDEQGNVITNAPIDFKATRELWDVNEKARENKTVIKHINEHTKRYIHRWYWNKGDANFRNKTAYCFIPCRKNKRELAKVLKDENNDVDFYTRYSQNKKF